LEPKFSARKVKACFLISLFSTFALVYNYPPYSQAAQCDALLVVWLTHITIFLFLPKASLSQKEHIDEAQDQD
jgi:hypothetical protein